MLISSSEYNCYVLTCMNDRSNFLWMISMMLFCFLENHIYYHWHWNKTSQHIILLCIWIIFREKFHLNRLLHIVQQSLAYRFFKINHHGLENYFVSSLHYLRLYYTLLNRWTNRSLSMWPCWTWELFLHSSSTQHDLFNMWSNVILSHI